MATKYLKITEIKISAKSIKNWYEIPLLEKQTMAGLRFSEAGRMV